MANRVRVAIVGTGYIGHYHARAAKSGARTELVGALGSTPEKGRAFSKEHGAPRAYASLDELTADPDLDVVVIATPNALHAPQALACLGAGKHLLIEKPLAISAAECEAIAAAAKEAGARVLVGHMWRFDREALALRDVVAEGALGEIVKTKGYGIHVNWGPSGWFADRERAGGGALVDMGVHALDTVRFLLGDPAPTRVYAEVRTVYGDYEVDDLSVLMVHWEGGAVSLIESGWWNPYMDGPEASTQLFGTRGYGRLFPTSATRIVDHKPELVALGPFPTRAEHCDQHIYDGQMAELADAVLEGRDPVPGIAHGATCVRICEAAYLSAAEGRAVQL